jgi:hypothetical protein
MARSPRRFAVALLWLALALLPMRGFAALLMPVGAAPAAVATVAAEAPRHHGAAMPCHGSAVQDSAAATAQPGDHTCSLCDLCHSGVAAFAAPVLTLPALPQDAPVALAAPSVEPRAPDSLFRPPRAHLA